MNAGIIDESLSDQKTDGVLGENVLISKGKFPWDFESFRQTAAWSLMNPMKNNNEFEYSSKLVCFLIDRFGAEVYRRQSIRFFVIKYFIEANAERLEKEKLTIVGETQNIATPELIEALCVLPFEDWTGLHFSFNFEQVIERVREIKGSPKK